MARNRHGDNKAGDEGVDDPAFTETQREKSQRSHRTEKRANDERFDDASDFGGQGAQRGHDMDEAEGTGYRGRDKSDTEDSAPENPLV